MKKVATKYKISSSLILMHNESNQLILCLMLATPNGHGKSQAQARSQLSTS